MSRSTLCTAALTGLALAGLSPYPSSAAALQATGAGALQGAQDAPLPVVVDAHTGRILSVGTPAPSSAGAAGGSESITTSMCFDNANLSGLYGLPPAGVEIVDWGVKGCQGTGLVTRLAVGYSTTALDPSVGGPGASFGIAIYEGTTGFGQLGVERARFDLTRMPGLVTGGQTVTYALFLDFGNAPLILADGNLGIGFESKDGVTGPLLTLAPNPTLGTQDLLDLYAPAPASGSNYITTGPPFPGLNTGSIALQVEELDPEPLASTVIDSGNGSNPLVFSEVQGAVIGDTWVGMVDLSGFPGATITAIGVSEGPYTPSQTSFGELLVNPASPGFFVDIGFGLHGQPIIPRVDLIGRTFRAQAAVLLAPGLQFTNALVVSTGF